MLIESAPNGGHHGINGNHEPALQPGPTRNPVLSGFNPDPTIVRVGNDYFLATSTFEYLPGVPIYHSTNLVEWRLIGHCLTRPSQLNLRTAEPGMGIFAPTLRYFRGRFYMTTVAFHKQPKGADGVISRGFYVWTDDIWNSHSWSDPVYLDVLGIDQDLYFDDTTGRVWLSLAKNPENDAPAHKGHPLAVYTGEIDIDTGTSLSEFKLARWSTEGNGVAEGPHIFKRGDYHYMICAEGGTEVEHQEWVLRSREGPMGPWELGERGVVNPMVFNGNHAEVRQTGHMDLVEGADGRWWAVFLAVRPVHVDGETRLSQLGRETFLAPVEWADDWPIVNRRQPISLNMDMGLLRTSERFREISTFAPKRDLMKDGWYRMRTPVKVDYSLLERPGSLSLRAGPYAITADEAPTMFLRKQLAFDGTWTVRLDAPVLQAGHSAGVSVWWSKYAHASLAIRGTAGGGRELVCRYPLLEKDDFEETIHPVADAAPIIFTVQATPADYTFSYSSTSAPNDAHQVSVLSSKLIVRDRPFDSIFTGTHFALWAAGAKGQGSLHSVHFSDMSWKGVRAGGQ